jgi:hypothetical protein
VLLRQLVAFDRRLPFAGPLQDVQRLGDVGTGSAFLKIAFHAQRRKLLGDRQVDELVEWHASCKHIGYRLRYWRSLEL